MCNFFAFEMDKLADYDKMEIVQGDEITNSIKRELAHTINGSASHNDTEAVYNPRGSSSQEN